MVLPCYVKFKRKFNPKLFTRPMIKFIKSKNQNNLVGVEIGVAEGNNSKSILTELSIKKLYLVDIWDTYVQDGIEDNFSKYFELAKKNLKQYKDKIEIIKKKSCDAIHDIPDNLDFVYIDGNHQYEFVKKDIELYYRKVKIGGVLGGDDFNNHFFGVMQAVIEFVTKNNLKICLEKNDWWIVKNG